MPDAKTGLSENNDMHTGAERRRAPLPQPDFTPYKNANAYPGTNFIFVGHSYDIELEAGAVDQMNTRCDAISGLFTKQEQFVPVATALNNEKFAAVLTRFESDLLKRLPETSLIGTAVDPGGRLIPQSFTVWRAERRKQRASQ